MRYGQSGRLAWSPAETARALCDRASRLVVECAGSWALVAIDTLGATWGPPVRSDHGKRIAILLPIKPTRAGLFRTWPRLARSDAIDPERHSKAISAATHSSVLTRENARKSGDM